MNRLALLALPAALALAPSRASAEPAETSPRQWGEASLGIVERTQYLAIDGAKVGESGLARGAGVELRYMMPIGWGAYYRWTDVATAGTHKASEAFEWEHQEYTAGVSRRLLRLGPGGLWQPRVQAQLDVGLGYSQIGTHERCTRSYAPWGTSCTTATGGRQQNVAGDALSLEARIGANVSYGPFTVGLDIGAAAYLTLVGGDNSFTPPGTFFAPSGQLRLGLALPY